MEIVWVFENLWECGDGETVLPKTFHGRWDLVKQSNLGEFTKPAEPIIFEILGQEAAALIDGKDGRRTEPWRYRYKDKGEHIELDMFFLNEGVYIFFCNGILKLTDDDKLLFCWEYPTADVRTRPTSFEIPPRYSDNHLWEFSRVADAPDHEH